MKIIGICGSLRKDSYNLKLLKNFARYLPEKTSYEVALLHDIPLYNGDVEETGIPSTVNGLTEKIIAADFIVFGCPEYNYSVTGVLKNTIDWLSRHSKKPLFQKNAAIIGASIGRFGTARAQYHLRQIVISLDLRFLNLPEIMLSEAHNKFDKDGLLQDEYTIKALKTLAQQINKLVKL